MELIQKSLIIIIFDYFLYQIIHFLKKKIIANKEPRCKLTSINNELDLNSYKVDTTTKCAEELIGKNSDTPWIKDKIIISIIFESI